MHHKFVNYQILAEKFIIEGNLYKAYMAYKKAYSYTKDKEEKIDLLFEMGDLLWQMNQLAKARLIYKKIIEICQEPGAYYALGILAENQDENFRTSIDYFQKAIELDPNYEQAYYYQALLWDRLGDRDKAKELMHQCLVIEPLDYTVYSDLASIYEEEGAYHKAQRFALKSLEIFPNYDKALYNLGVIHQRLGKLDAALDSYKKAISSNPYDPSYYLNISAIYLEENRLSDAWDILSEGIEKKLDSVNLFYNRACTCIRQGDKSKALEDLKKAIMLNSDALIWARRDQDLMEISKEIHIDYN